MILLCSVSSYNPLLCRDTKICLERSRRVYKTPYQIILRLIFLDLERKKIIFGLGTVYSKMIGLLEPVCTYAVGNMSADMYKLGYLM